MRAIRTLALAGILGSGLLTGCSLDALVDDLEELLQDPQIMAAFSAAAVQDALEQLDLSQLGGDPFTVIEQGPIGLGVQQAERPGGSPAYAPLAMATCDGESIPQDNLCAISAPSGQWQLDMVWYYHVDWTQYANYPTTTDFYMNRPKLDPSNDGSVYTDDNADMYPAISIVELAGTMSLPRLGISATLAINNLNYSDYNLALGYADVFTNDTQAIKTVNFSNEDSKVKQLIESFRGNMGGAPDGDAELTGVNGVVDVTDTAWYFSQFAEGRAGAQLYREISAAPGGNLLVLGRVQGAVVPGSYAEIVTPAENQHVQRISRVASVVDADNLVLTEIVTFASDATAYRVVTFTPDTVTVTGQFPTHKGAGTYTATLARSGGAFSATRTFPEGLRVARIEESGTVTRNSSDFTRTLTLADGTTVTETASVRMTRHDDGTVDTVTVSYDRGDEGSATVTADRGEFGFVDLSVDAVSGDGVVLHVGGTLDKSGAGSLTLEINRPDIEPEIDIQGSLERASDGSVSGTLQVTDADGNTQEAEVNAQADAFNRLLVRARADARGTARAGQTTK